MAYKREYEWAVSKGKLFNAIAKLESDKKIDPSVEITEETIRAEYVKHAGLIVEKVRTNSTKDVEETVEELPQEEKPKSRRTSRE